MSDKKKIIDDDSSDEDIVSKEIVSTIVFCPNFSEIKCLFFLSELIQLHKFLQMTILHQSLTDAQIKNQLPNMRCVFQLISFVVYIVFDYLISYTES